MAGLDDSTRHREIARHREIVGKSPLKVYSSSSFSDAHLYLIGSFVGKRRQRIQKIAINRVAGATRVVFPGGSPVSMSTNNTSQTAAGVGEATEVIQAAADSAQPVSAPTIVEAAATATAFEPAPAAAEAAEPSESTSEPVDADVSAGKADLGSCAASSAAARGLADSGP